MRKFILKTKNGEFLHFEMGGIVGWGNINPDALCTFDTREEAAEAVEEFELKDVSIVSEHFAENFF